MVTIEGISDQKSSHDFIYLTLREVSPEEVELEISVEINTGMHLIAKALGALFSKPMEQIMCRHIYQNFEALCEGKETKRMSQEELNDRAKNISGWKQFLKERFRKWGMRYHRETTEEGLFTAGSKRCAGRIYF